MTNTRTRAWAPGDHLAHRFNPELGVGRVTAIDGRTLVVEFPRTGTTLRLAANADTLVPVDAGGAPARERSLLDRLAAGDLDDARDFLTHLDILHLRGEDNITVRWVVHPPVEGSLGIATAINDL
jgi:hypothetical protein